jgi:ABC-type branched-subunit amino acid transport system substrate-binding protein
MRSESQRRPATIARGRGPEHGADLDQKVDDPGRRRRRYNQRIDHIGHRTAGAGLDIRQGTPTVHGEIGTRELIFDTCSDQGCLSEQRQRICDSFHDLPSEGSPNRGDTAARRIFSMTDPASSIEPRTERPTDFRVALALPRRGPAGIFGLECHAAAELAAAEIDAAGGVAGRTVHFVHVDAGGEPAAVAADIEGLVDSGSIDAVTGWHLSNARQAIAKVVRGRVPYVYAAAYEGGERSDGVLCSGEVPGDQIVASLQWLRTEAQLRRWFIVGNDYVWPRGTAAATRIGLQDTDVSILGERFLPLNTDDPAVWGRVLSEVVRSAAQGVISLLVGSDAVRFNRAFGERGLDATITRFSPFTDETVILASGADATANLFISAGWFAGLGSASAAEFTAGFARAFDLVNGAGPIGESAAPPPGTMAETTYSGVHLLAGIAGSSVPTVQDARRAFTKWGWDSPHGPVDLDQGSARHPVHMARARGVELDVIARIR